MGIDILGKDIMGVDILGIDIPAPTLSHMGLGPNTFCSNDYHTRVALQCHLL